eukprot:Phypoly_transcript_24414.p1 GENE.Phypoly_transcript_24414~~Phypoly_transcript_24414.p1  ORF type:complete len:123 (+),score=9.72 Phypoly_transcript_24414:96-464(+)
MNPRLCAIFLLCNLIFCQAQQYAFTIEVNKPTGNPVSCNAPWYPGVTLLYSMIQCVTYTNANLTFSITFNSAQYGGFITTLCGTASTSSLFWLFSVNGKEAEVGVEEYEPQPQDKIVWTYSS